jgi:hypothetical protein
MGPRPTQRRGRRRQEANDAASTRPAAPDDAASDDRLVAVVRSPTSVFIYWVLRGAQSATARPDREARTNWELRVFDLTRGDVRAVAVEPGAGNCYVGVEPGRTYRFELAAGGPGRCQTVCGTGDVATPAAGLRAAPGSEEMAVRGPGGRRRRSWPLISASAVPGLRYESTVLHLGSSPRGRWSGSVRLRPATGRRTP